MFETDDITLISRVRLPKFLIRWQYTRFMRTFDEMFSGGEVSKELKEESSKIALYNKIKNILPLLYLGLLYEETEYQKELFKHYFGKDFEKGEDLMLIKNEIGRLSKRFKVMYPEKEVQSGGLTLEELIVSTESILDRTIDRGLRLYQFKTYYDLAIKKVKDNG